MVLLFLGTGVMMRYIEAEQYSFHPALSASHYLDHDTDACQRKGAPLSDILPSAALPTSYKQQKSPLPPRKQEALARKAECRAGTGSTK